MNGNDDKLSNGKNSVTVKCKHCPSIILTPASATLSTVDFDLPNVVQTKSELNVVETEPLNSFWMVDDVYTFHNVGFSTTVDNTKFLVCADCEVGPIGYHDLDSKKSYVALTRVEHVPK